MKMWVIPFAVQFLLYDLYELKNKLITSFSVTPHTKCTLEFVISFVKIRCKKQSFDKKIKNDVIQEVRTKILQQALGYRYTFRFQLSVMWNVWIQKSLLNKNSPFQNQKFQIGSEVASYTFFKKQPIKFRWGSMFLFFKAFQPHNVLTLSWFFTKTSDPLMMKNTPNEIVDYC